MKNPYVESDEPDPLNAYGRTKLAQERVTLEWPAGIVVRTAWLYSPTGRNFVKTILALARERVEEARERASDESLGIANVTPQPTPLTVVDDQVGSPTYAPHLAAGVLELLARGPAPGIYHMAGSGACSWRELARETVIRAGLPVEVHPVTSEEFGAVAPPPPTRPSPASAACLPSPRGTTASPPAWRPSRPRGSSRSHHPLSSPTPPPSPANSSSPNTDAHPSPPASTSCG